jgi:hypothetical protein
VLLWTIVDADSHYRKKLAGPVLVPSGEDGKEMVLSRCV